MGILLKGWFLRYFFVFMTCHYVCSIRSKSWLCFHLSFSMMLLRRLLKISVHYVQVLNLPCWKISLNVDNLFMGPLLCEIVCKIIIIYLPAYKQVLDMQLHFCTMNCAWKIGIPNQWLTDYPPFFFLPEMWYYMFRRNGSWSTHWKITALQGFFLPSDFERLHCPSMFIFSFSGII